MPTPSSVRRFLLLSCAAISLLFLSVTSGASAAVYQGSIDDPDGDAPAAGVDIRTSSATYDSETGAIRIETRLSAARSIPVQYTAAVGTQGSEGNCGAPLGILGSIQPDDITIWLRENDGSSPAEFQGQAQIDENGAYVTLTAEAPELAGLNPNCAAFLISEPDQPANVYDETPTFGIATKPKQPKLAAALSGSSQVKRGGKAKVRLKVRNTGDGPASSVKVNLKAKGAGSVAKGKRAIGKLAPGKSRTVAFTIKAGRRAKGKIRLTAKVTGKGGLKASAGKTVRIKLPTPKPPPVKGGKGLVGKLFWGFEAYRFDRSPDILGLYFTNSKFVHWGIPKDGLNKCGKVTAKLDEDGELQPGCLRYSYNQRTGKLTVGNAKGTYRNGNLKLKMDEEMWRVDGETWFNSAFAKPGTRLKVTLQNRGYFGACGISPSCTTWLELLTLDRSGKFGRTRSSLTTGGGGSLPFIAIGNYPPEDRGRYQVLSNGRIRFNYDNGEVSTETLIIQTNERGRPDPAREGVLLDDVWFYKDEED